MLIKVKKLVEFVLSKLLCKFSPDHVAIILDGNRRYARLKGITHLEGHKKGAILIKDILPLMINLGVKYVSLFVFSIENFSRSNDDVQGIFTTIKDYLNKEKTWLHEMKCKVLISGKLDMIPEDISVLLKDLENKTRNNEKIVLNICCAYSSTAELELAMNRYLYDYKYLRINRGEKKRENNENRIEDLSLNDEIYKSYQYQSDLPFPNIMIRTSGETRLSDFLIYQVCHNAKIYFVHALWPQINNMTILFIILHYILFYN